MPLKLIVANKAYSSWSLRPWILLAHFKIPFEETVIPLDLPETRALILEHSPSGKCPGADRRADQGVGIAGDHRIRRREIPGKGDLAARQGGAGARALARRRDARRLPGAAPALPEQFPPPGAQNRADRGGRGRRRADRGGLGACARDLRQGRAVPVRPLQRRRRDVRAGRQPLPHLRRSGYARDARLHGGGDGAAGVEGLGRRRRGGRMAHRKIRQPSEPRECALSAARRGRPRVARALARRAHGSSPRGSSTAPGPTSTTTR